MRVRRASEPGRRIWPWLLAFVAVVILAWRGFTLRDGHPAMHVLRWVGTHWLNAVAITAIATIATAVAAMWPLLINRRDHGAASASRTMRERRAMLARVRSDWISGVLEPSMDASLSSPLSLSLRTRPDLLDRNPQLADHKPRRFGPTQGGIPTLQTFEDAGHRLLITGEPGSGKTTMLLQLASDLLRRASQDPDEPIPVVFNLTSWTVGRPELATWLSGELETRYEVPRNTAAAWIEQDELTLLLDGLDEVPDQYRGECIDAINAYRHAHGLVPIALCSRTKAIEHASVKPHLNRAVEITPLTDNRVGEFLDHLETVGAPMDGVRELLASDEKLRNMMRTPLVLRVIALAYRERSPDALRQPGSTDELQDRLWQAYTDSMFEQHPLAPGCGYTQDEAIRWLGWLASAMRDHHQSEFYLDRLTADWLPTPRTPPRSRLQRLVLSLPPVEALPPEELKFSPKEFARTLRDPDLYKSRFTWIPGISVTLALVTADRALAGLIAGLATTLATLGVLSLSIALDFGPRKNRTRPNEGIRLSGRNALLFPLLIWVVYTLIILLPYLVYPTNIIWYLSQLPLIAIFTLMGIWDWGGLAFLTHYAIRSSLMRADAIPPDYERFLDAMSERLLLHRAGSGYLFMHQMLRDSLSSAYASHRGMAEWRADR